MSLAPLLLGYMSSARPATSLLFCAPWVIAGVIKIIYDLLLYGLYKCDGSMRHGEANAAKADVAEAKAAASSKKALSEPLLGAGEDAEKGGVLIEQKEPLLGNGKGGIQ